MKHTYYRIAFIAALFAVPLLSGCYRGKESPRVDVEVADLVELIPTYGTYDSLGRAGIRREYGPVLEALCKVINYGEYGDTTIGEWSISLPVRVFTPAVDSVYGKGAHPVADALGAILGAAGDVGLELPPRRYAQVVWGRMESVLFVDSVMLVALNHYLGAEYPGYDRFPVYQRMLKEPAQLPYDLAEALVATAYPYSATGEDATLKARMLYEGALAYARMALVPHATEAAVLGYNDQDYRWLTDNADALWTDIIAAKTLYDTSESTISRYIAPAPAVNVNGHNYPGRVGRFMGYRMVADYLRDHPDTSLSTLLSPDFYTRH